MSDNKKADLPEIHCTPLGCVKADAEVNGKDTKYHEKAIEIIKRLNEKPFDDPSDCC